MDTINTISLIPINNTMEREDVNRMFCKKVKSVVWEYATVLDAKKAKCNFCGLVISNTATRLKSHMINACNKTPHDVKDQLRMDTRANNYSIKNEADSPPPSQTPLNSACSSKENGSSIVQTLIQTPPEPLTRSEKQELDHSVAKFIYESSVPFKIVEQKSFQQLCGKLRPSYCPPTKNQISGKLLSIHYEKIRRNTANALRESDSVSILIDGFSNTRTDSTLNILASTPSLLFLQRYQTKSKPYSIESIAEIIEEQIRKIGVDKVVAVVCDNAFSLMKVQNIIEAKYPLTQVLICNAHGFNLLVEDILAIPAFSDILSQCKRIVKEILSSIWKRSRFQEMTGKSSNSLRIRSPLRGYNLVYILQSVYESGSYLNDMSMNNIIQDKENLDSIFDRGGKHFWRVLQNLLQLLRPLNSLIDEIDTTNLKISETTEKFNAIITGIDNVLVQHFPELRAKILLIIEERRRCMERGLHFFANLIDPRFQGRSLSDTQRNQAYDYLNSFLGNLHLKEEETGFLSTFQNYLAQEGPFAHQLQWKDSFVKDPYLWWKTFARNPNDSLFAREAVRIFSIPASSVSIRRYFGYQSKACSENRDALSKENFEKLLTIQFNCNLQAKESTLNDIFMEKSDQESDCEWDDSVSLDE